MPALSISIDGDTASGVDLLTLTRDDTGDGVAFSPAAFTDAGGGAWSYTFTAPADGLSYSYTYRITWADDGSTTDEAGTFVDGGATGSHFATTQAVRDFAGPANVDTYSDKDSDGDAGKKAAAIERALDSTDADIQRAWRFRLDNAGATYAALDPADLADDAEAAWLSETAAMGATVRLYRGRGTNDAGNDADGKMAGVWKEYQARLQAIRDGTELLAQQAAAGVDDDEDTPGAFTNVRMRFEPECAGDEYSSSCG